MGLLKKVGFWALMLGLTASGCATSGDPSSVGAGARAGNAGAPSGGSTSGAGGTTPNPSGGGGSGGNAGGTTTGAGNGGADNAGGDGGSDVADPPAAPSDLVLTIVNGTTVGLEWTDNADDETGCSVYFADDATKPASATQQVSPDVTTATVEGLTSGTEYTFWVECYNSAGASDAVSAAVTPIPVPEQPIGLVVTGSASDIQLSWTDAATFEDGYRVYWSTTDTQPDTANEDLAPNSTGFAVPGAGLTAYQTYYFWIEAYNDLGESAPATGSGAMGSPPVAPTGLTLTVTGVDVLVSWTDNSSTESGFNLYWSTSGTKPSTANHTAAANAVSYTASDLTPGTTYHFWVEATNLIGASSDITGSATTDTAPAAPTNFAAVIVDDTTLEVSFTDAADNEDGYNVYWSTTNTQPVTPSAILAAGADTGSTLTASASGLTSYTRYYFWIEGINEVGAGPALTGQAAAGQLPAAPSGVAIDVTTSPFVVTASWTDNADNEDGFVLYWSTTGEQPAEGIVLDADTTSYDLDEVRGGATYQFWVEATNLIGTSAAATGSATQATKDLNWGELWVEPNGYLHLAIVRGAGEPAGTPEAPTPLVMYHSADPEAMGSPNVINPWWVGDLSGNGIDPTQTHYFWVEAQGANGSLFSLRTLEPASAVTGVQATPADTSVALAWDDAGAGAAGYRVRQSTVDDVSQATLAGSFATNSGTVTSLSSGTPYYFWVSAAAPGIGGWGFEGPRSSVSTSTTGQSLGPNLAVGRPGVASTGTAAAAFDGNATGTRWESVHGVDPQWIYVELDSEVLVTHVTFVWEGAYAQTLQVQVCPASCDVGGDPNTWAWQSVESIDRTLTAFPNNELVELDTQVTGQFVRMLGTARGTPYGYSLWEFQVYSAP